MITNINEFKNFLLNESKSFDDVQFDNIVTRGFIANQLTKGDVGEHYYVTYYKQQNETGDLSDDKIVKSVDFIDWLKDELSYKIEAVESTLRNKIEDDKITVYRSITTDDRWFPNLLKSKCSIGTFWSYDAESAEPHWGYNDPKTNHTALIKSTIDIKHVDWVNTFQLNIDIDVEDEHEVTVLDGSPVQIEELTIDGVPVKLSQELKNKIFFA